MFEVFVDVAHPQVKTFCSRRKTSDDDKTEKQEICGFIDKPTTRESDGHIYPLRLLRLNYFFQTR